MGHEHELCQAQKAENTDPRTNYAVKYATARDHLRSKGKPHACNRTGIVQCNDSLLLVHSEQGVSLMDSVLSEAI